MLAERRELGSEYGQQAFGVLLFQDLTAIPVLALIPLLGAVGDGGFSAIGFAKSMGVIAAVIAGGHLLLPLLFRMISRANSLEVFCAAALLLVLGTAALMQAAGLSVTLGAFLAGVLLANSEFRHEIESHIQPFKGLLLGLFFMAVGMSIDLDLIARHPLLIAACVVAVYLIKAPAIYALGRWLGRLPHADALLLGGLLGQAGEFAFVVLTEGRDARILSAEHYGIALAVVGVSMALSPLAMLAAQAWGKRSAATTTRPFDALPSDAPRVIIAGFGRVGQIVSRILHAQRIPHTVLEPKVEQVDLSRRFGSELYYGDPSRPELLRAARADQAELVVVAIDDPELSVRTARVVRRLYPKVKLVARARNRQHVFKLMDLNAEVVVRETFHSALHLTRDVLIGLGLDPDSAQARIDRFREHDERMLQEQYLIHDDESALIQSAAEARAELVRLFEADREKGGA
jgi:glutathione-regulated potassium-efflux system protein KefB